MQRPLQTHRKVLGQVLDHARRRVNQECCGLLAGRRGVIMRAYPATNVAADPKKNYAIAPLEIVRLLREFRARGLDFVGIYHSHPNGKNEPSARDIELAYYSEVAYVIVTPRPYADNPVRAFSIRAGRVTELEIETIA